MTTTTELAVRQTPIQTGDTAPDFTLKDQDKNDWTLSEIAKQHPALVPQIAAATVLGRENTGVGFFYDTGCRSFRRHGNR